jgi:hypothetical protein
MFSRSLVSRAGERRDRARALCAVLVRLYAPTNALQKQGLRTRSSVASNSKKAVSSSSDWTMWRCPSLCAATIQRPSSDVPALQYSHAQPAAMSLSAMMSQCCTGGIMRNFRISVQHHSNDPVRPSENSHRSKQRGWRVFEGGAPAWNLRRSPPGGAKSSRSAGRRVLAGEIRTGGRRKEEINPNGGLRG